MKDLDLLMKQRRKKEKIIVAKHEQDQDLEGLKNIQKVTLKQI